MNAAIIRTARAHRGAAAAMSTLLGACASSSSPDGTVRAHTFGGDAYASSTTDDGALRVAVRTDPEPPPRGTCDVELTVTERDGTPADGLGVSVVPWMPAMGHGASTTPSVTPEGGGRYVLSRVNMFMPGEWELRCTFSGTVNTHATPVLTVP